MERRRNVLLSLLAVALTASFADVSSAEPCSGRGTLVRDTCVCDVGFGGADCALSLTAPNASVEPTVTAASSESPADDEEVPAQLRNMLLYATHLSEQQREVSSRSGWWP